MMSKSLNWGELCVIRAPNRQSLVDAINEHIDSAVFAGQPNTFYLVISFQDDVKYICGGGSVRYPTEADVPVHSVPCPCGNPRHWLIKYDDNLEVARKES